MQMYINHFGVWWPISCGPLNNNNVLTKGKGLDVRSIWPSPGPLHGHDSFLKRVNRPKKKKIKIRLIRTHQRMRAIQHCFEPQVGQGTPLT